MNFKIQFTHCEIKTLIENLYYYLYLLVKVEPIKGLYKDSKKMDIKTNMAEYLWQYIILFRSCKLNNVIYFIIRDIQH